MVCCKCVQLHYGSYELSVSEYALNLHFYEGFLVRKDLKPHTEMHGEFSRQDFSKRVRLLTIFVRTKFLHCIPAVGTYLRMAYSRFKKLKMVWSIGSHIYYVTRDFLGWLCPHKHAVWLDVIYLQYISYLITNTH